MCLNVTTYNIQSPSPSQIQKGKGNLASGLSLKCYGPPTPPPYNFKGSGWEYMVQIEAPSTSECWEGVHSPGGQQREEEHRVVLHVQVEHFQKMSQDHKPKSKIPGLGLSLSTTSLVCFIRTSLMILNKLRV